MEYRCANRDKDGCTTKLKIFSTSKKPIDLEILRNGDYSNAKVILRGTHSCNQEKVVKTLTEKTQENNFSVTTIKKNYDELKEMMRKETLKGPTYFFEKALLKNISISFSKTKQLHKEVVYK